MFKLLLTLIPTLLFILILLWAFLIGLKRGFRKSVILLIQALVAFIIALTFYLIIVNMKASDEMIVNITNNFMGAGGLQRQLGVSEANTTLTDILTELIIKNVDYGVGVQLALEENANYLHTLVSFAYHVVFFFVALLLYDILLFLFYLIYVIFYPERRHKAKMQNKENEDGSTYVYKKRHLFGGLVGVLRGFVKAMFVMSFVGAFLFLIGGGIGDYEYKDDTLEIKDESRKRIYNVYEALGSYGTSGIFKILNTIKDKNEVPYYFFIANTIFSGKFEDPDMGISKDVYFVRELGEYTRFVRSTFDLMCKYDKETMSAVVNGEIEANDDRLFAIFGNAEFQEEFAKLIDLVEEDTYIINFALSMVDSIAYHFDDTTLSQNVDDKTKEIIKILLVSNHYSSYIPDDANAKASNKPVEVLKLSNLLTRNDVKELAKGLLSILSIPKDTDSSKRILLYNEYLVPQLKKLSILNIPERKQEVNGVFERLFVALENMYSNKVQNAELTVEQLKLVADVKVDWAGEIGNLLDVIYNLGNLVGNVYTKDDNIVNCIFRIFDKNREDYQANMTAYDNIAADLEKSKVLDKLLSIEPIYNGFMSMMTSLYSDIYVPNDIKFANDEDDYGELHWFLGALKTLMTDDDNAEIMPRLLQGLQEGTNTLGDLIKLCQNIVDDGIEEGSTLWYVAQSDVMQILLSSVLFANQHIGDNFTIYIPDSAKVTVDGEAKNLITSGELLNTIIVVPSFLNDMLKFIDEDDENYNNYDYVLETIKNGGDLLFASDILEATIANVLIDKFKDSDMIYIPTALRTPESWLEANDGEGELKAVVDSISELGLSIVNITNESIADVITGMSKPAKDDPSVTKLEYVTRSMVIYSTLSKNIDKYITADLISEQAKTLSKITIDGDVYYKKEEITALVNVVDELALDIANIDLNNVLDSIGNLNNASTIDSSKTKLDILYESIMTKSMIYVELGNILDSNEMIVNHANAKEKEQDVLDIYKKSEVSELVAFINNIGNPVLSDIALDNITLSDATINNIGASEILKATLSKNLLDKDVLVVPASDYDSTNNYIKGNELTALLFSVKNGLGIDNADEFDVDSVKLPENDKIDALLDSSIMRATISDKISAGEGNDVFVAPDKASIETSYQNESFVLISSQELKAFIVGIGTLSKDGSYEVEISNSKLHELAEDDTAFDKAMASSILHIIISDFIKTASGLPGTMEDVIDVTAVQVTTRGVISSLEIKTFALTLM